MSNDYRRQTIVAQDRGEAYNVVLDLGFWWGNAEGKFEKEGDRVRITFGKKSFWTFEAARLRPGELLELKCVEADHIHEGMPESIRKEWEGTSLVWRFSDKDGGTLIDFNHVGLNNNLACYSICEPGWDYYLVEGLGQHLDIIGESIMVSA